MKLILKGLEKLRPPRDIHEWMAGEPHENKENQMSTSKATASLMIDSMIKAACGTGKAIQGQQSATAPVSSKDPAGKYQPPAGVQSLPVEGKRNMGAVQAKMTGQDLGKADLFGGTGQGSTPAAKVQGKLSGGEQGKTSAPAATASKPSSGPGLVGQTISLKPIGGSKPKAEASKPASGPGLVGQTISLKPIGKGGEIKKDFEHMAGEYKKMPPPSPASQKQATSLFGPSASQEGAAAKKQAISSAGPGSSETRSALASIKPAAQGARGGATGAVAGHPSGVLSSAPLHDPVTPKKVAGMSKSQEATEILKAMFQKAKSAERSSGNPANEQGPVSGTAHGGQGPATTTCSITEEESHAGKGPAQTSVSGTPHAGSGPAQTSVSGMPHAGSGPAQTSVSGTPSAGREGAMNKAVGAMSVPQMPRAMAMAMDQWRSATNVLTRGNSRFAKHAGTGPLNGEVLAQVEDDSQERTTRHYRNPVLKACGGCGRTYTLRKSDDSCPTCSSLPFSVMSKSRGGMLIPSEIQ